MRSAIYQDPILSEMINQCSSLVVHVHRDPWKMIVSRSNEWLVFHLNQSRNEMGFNRIKKSLRTLRCLIHHFLLKLLMKGSIEYD